MISYNLTVYSYFHKPEIIIDANKLGKVKNGTEEGDGKSVHKIKIPSTANQPGASNRVSTVASLGTPTIICYLYHTRL